MRKGLTGIILLSSFLLGACTGLEQKNYNTNVLEKATVLIPIDTETIIIEESNLPVATETYISTPTAVYTPTPDLRPLPEQWQTWPIIPSLSQRMKEVYLEGIIEGNDPSKFAKAGDCQSVPVAFLGRYDNPNRLNFNENYEHLYETIDNFAGSFERESPAVNGGFNLPAIFSPLRSDPNICSPSENPLECELRIQNPSFVFIRFEIWYKSRTAENYEAYLRDAIEYTLSQNVVPILATKADNIEGNHSINLTTAQVAHDYDIPLFNFWRAVQPLPDHGIDWECDSTGFHIIYKAWSTLSFTGLQTIDSLWRDATDYVNINLEYP